MKPIFRFSALVFAAVLAACDSGDSIRSSDPGVIAFGAPLAESEVSEQAWRALLDDLTAEVGLEIHPVFAPDSGALVEAMAADEVHVGWLPALPALEAVDRAGAEVAARPADPRGRDSYVSILIVQAGSGVTLDQVLACDRTLNLGLDEAEASPGALAPMTFLFGPRGIDPEACFGAVRSADSQANAASVASGALDVAAFNTVDAVAFARQSPDAAARVAQIWESPPLPRSGIVVRGDLDPSLKERIRSFFLTYGQGDGPEAERQRRVLASLDFSEFRPADGRDLDPIREMRADQALRAARAAGDAAAAAAAEAELERLRTAREVQP